MLPHPKAKRMMATQSDFYTPTGIHVYFKDNIENKEIDPELVVGRLEDALPLPLLSEIEMIIIGWFEEFERRSINAFYDSGTLYISNVQDNNSDMFDDLVHETSHSLEQPHGMLIYGDGELEKEFLRKRGHLHDLLWAKGYKIPKVVFYDPEYNEELDMFLYEDLGYEKLSSLIRGLFISAYSVTSLREYFATGFTDFYLDPNHDFLKTTCPVLYKKLLELHNLEEN